MSTSRRPRPPAGAAAIQRSQSDFSNTRPLGNVPPSAETDGQKTDKQKTQIKMKYDVRSLRYECGQTDRHADDNLFSSYNGSATKTTLYFFVA